MTMNDEGDRSVVADIRRHATGIVAAYVSRNPVGAERLPELIAQVHGTLAGLGVRPRQSERPRPAVPVRQSITPDYLVCLEDGRRLKMLKRHLRAAYGLSPSEYRERWGLPGDYPMVAPNYASRRSDLARQMGLGTRTTPHGGSA